MKCWVGRIDSGVEMRDAHTGAGQAKRPQRWDAEGVDAPGVCRGEFGRRGGDRPDQAELRGSDNLRHLRIRAQRSKTDTVDRAIRDAEVWVEAC